MSDDKTVRNIQTKPSQNVGDSIQNTPSQDPEIKRIQERVQKGERLQALGSLVRAGLGGRMRHEVDTRAQPTLDRGTARAAAYARKKKERGEEQQKIGATNPKPEKKKKMTGVGFYFVLFFAVIKDLSDLFINSGIIISVLTIFTGLFIQALIAFYLFYSGVTPNFKKVAAWALSLLVEATPFLSFLPAAALSLIMIRILENGVRGIPFFGEKLDRAVQQAQKLSGAPLHKDR